MKKMFALLLAMLLITSCSPTIQPTVSVPKDASTENDSKVEEEISEPLKDEPSGSYLCVIGDSILSIHFYKENNIALDMKNLVPSTYSESDGIHTFQPNFDGEPFQFRHEQEEDRLRLIVGGEDHPYISCGHISDEEPEFTTENTVVQNDEPTKVGETLQLTKDGEHYFDLTINSVTVTSDRNRFHEREYPQVIVINYTYENISKEDGLYIFSSHFTVIDEDRNVANTYPVSRLLYGGEAPVGTKATSEEAFGLITESDKIRLVFNPTIFGDNTFEFELEITK